MADWLDIHGEHDDGGAHDGGMVLDGRHRLVVVCRNPWGGRRL